ncbi:MAG TPA: nitrile hydratase subunit beta [Roseomonas sp.]|jgi:nitrile hydratase
MNGMHDLGGRQGFGQVRHTPFAPTYHADWEKRIDGLKALLLKHGYFNMDEYRHAIERMEPRHYLAAGYYERVLTAVATLCVEKGVATRQELDVLSGGACPLSGPSAAGRPNAADRAPLRPGDRVRVKDDHFAGHIRMPGYIRGKPGVVVAESPAYPFPDAHAHGIEAPWEPTYDVRFRTQDLWPDGSDDASVHVGVFQSYLVKLT